MKHLLAIVFSVLLASALPAAQPNIVFILADDMGYGDLGCYGHPEAKTPVIDQLASDGVRFTQHYANGPECSPTRTAFLTGRYQQRAGGLECAIGTGNVGRYDDAIRLAKARQLGLPAKQTLLPSALKKPGYSSGVFGKWHLGYEPQFNPLEHGWDEFFGYMGGNVHYFNHRELSKLHVLYRGRLPVYEEGYMTHLITDSSLDFIERNKDRPFFLFVSHETPHFPFQGPGDAKKLVDKSNWTEPDAKTYVAMLEDLDGEVGRVLTSLKKHKLEKNTLVVFVSDNGGFARAANMGPLSGAKSTTLEGGIRVPLIMRWPGRIRPGTTSTQVCATFDLTRSILNLAGAEAPAEQLDGFDLVNHITEGRKDFSRTLFWRGKRGERTWSAVRSGDLKYVRKVEGETSEWLFDLASDLAEKNDLSSSRPGEARRLKKLLADWEKDVEALR
jgi:arylsulfatase A-like enzyme